MKLLFDEVKMIIERPWEELYCEQCIFCIMDDFCSVYRLGTSHVYCPQIRNCEKFKRRKAK